MFKPDGPEALRAVGETEFVNGIAAMSASGLYGRTRVAAGIVGTAALRLGDAAAAVLDAQIAAGGGRFRGIRLGAAWDADPAVPNHRTRPPQGLFLRDDFRAGFAQLAPRGLTFEAWCYHRADPRRHRAGPRLPRHHDHPRPLRRAARRRPLRGPGARGLRASGAATSTSSPPARTWWPSSAGSTWRSTASAGTSGRGRRGSQELADATRPYYEYTIEKFGVDRCMFESNFPVDEVSCSYTVLWNSFKRLTAGLLGGREGQALPRHRRPGLPTSRLTARCPAALPRSPGAGS